MFCGSQKRHKTIISYPKYAFLHGLDCSVYFVCSVCSVGYAPFIMTPDEAMIWQPLAAAGQNA
jgi:hypothetical protein